MAYTTIDKPSDYFNTVLYSGNSSTQSITGVGFQPDFVWIKNRSAVYSNNLFDSVKGVQKWLYSDSTSVEQTGTNRLNSFDSDGFTLGSNAAVNNSGNSLVSWNWLAGGTASSNTDGSITSSVSANTTSGFSIVSYAGNGTAGSTIGHGLGVAPKMIILKDRDGADSWVVYHNSLAITEYLILNSTLAALTDNEIIFYDTDPTSSVFTVGSHNTVNQSGHNYIAYCFAEKKGYSKFGSYTGNGNSDGTFVYTGFKPAWVMFKRTDTTNSWMIYDDKRNTFNPEKSFLFANASDAEADTSTAQADFLSNGFKLRGTGNINNGSGGTYIYMAFAENPFVTSTGIPCTAR